MRALVWFREDLRMLDNPALFYATEEATEGVAAVFCVTPSFWQKHHMAPIRQSFLLNGVFELSNELAKKNILLKVIHVENEDHLSEMIHQYAESIGANALYFNHQYEVNEQSRDKKITRYFQDREYLVKSFDDQIIFKANEIRTQEGNPFKVFTPFKTAWIKHARIRLPRILPVPDKQSEPVGERTLNLTLESSDLRLSFWPAGEKAAQHRLKDFLKHKISEYHIARDFPFMDGTSKLSPYLNAGMISTRQCFHAALQTNQGEWDSGNLGVKTWISELIWREFYKHILINFPYVSKHKPFKPETSSIEWHHDEDLLLAWQTGKTGFPFVDAGMRQLNATGWMHNRLRMVVSMFLTKTLFIDWRLGEKYFIENLIDGDLAANNGGWQWCASTGADAAPYFRIFNPIRQSERFDPDGQFIRQYCQELSELDNKSIHEPSDSLFKGNYPAPIVDHDIAKNQVLRAFKRLKTEKL
ncbi:MAG: deoxyribodipyrimidine photo-lyase [Proteobacteria bacterium]|nr:deoxyribodipyrimidine photo-lyase [Pseudomonadota bacterium]